LAGVALGRAAPDAADALALVVAGVALAAATAEGLSTERDFVARRIGHIPQPVAITSPQPSIAQQPVRANAVASLYRGERRS
jgi:hypothetical protein